MVDKFLFRDRLDAGHQLAQAVLAEMAQRELHQLGRETVVYALPRGGLPVAEPIAQILRCHLSVVVAKKVTRPDNPELAIGAVTSTGETVRGQLDPFSLSDPDWDAALAQAQAKADRQWNQFAAYCPRVETAGNLAILVDDGIATGMTMTVAAQALRSCQPIQLWICAPVAPKRMLRQLRTFCDRLIVLAVPANFWSVSRFYEAFPQVEMEEAIGCLQRQNEFLEVGS